MAATDCLQAVSTGTGAVTVGGDNDVRRYSPWLNCSEATTTMSTNNTSDDQHTLAHLLITSVVLGLIIMATIVGNVFVIAAIILERNLHNVANYLIASLAVADLLVAALVMPLAAVNEVSSGWFLGREACDAFISFDVLCCTSSILHLVAISLDRYWAVTRVDYIHNRSARRILVMVAASWGLSALISLPPLFAGHTPQRDPDISGICLISQDWAYTVFSTLGAFYLPMIVMSVIYARVYRAAQYRIRKRTFRRQANGNAATTGGAVVQLLGRGGPPAESCDDTPQPLLGSVSLCLQHDVTQSTADTQPEVTSAPVVMVTADGAEDEAKDDVNVESGGVGTGSAVANISAVSSTPPSPGDIVTIDQAEPMGVVFESLSSPTTTTGVSPDTLRPPVPFFARFLDGSWMYNRGRSGPGAAAQRDNNSADYSLVNGTKRQPLHTNLADARRRAREKQEQRRERKAATTLAVVTGTFLVCWLPFFILALVRPFCADSCYYPPLMVSIIGWLGYFNSLLNPIIYTVFNPDFRSAFRKILFGKYRNQSALARMHALQHLPFAPR